MENIDEKKIILNNVNVKYFQEFLIGNLLNGFVQKIQMLDNEDNFLKIKINCKDKKNTLIVGNGIMVITKYELNSRDQNKGFSLNANKILLNKKIIGIKQKNNEKIIEFEFDNNYMIFELFSTKNIVITDKEYNIIDCLIKEEWKDRTLKPKHKYIFPESITKSIFDFEINDVDKIYKKENIIYDIINNINVSPNLVELLIKYLNINKEKYDSKELKSVLLNLQNIYQEKICFDKIFIIDKNNKYEIYNIELKNIDSKCINVSYNEFLDDLIIKNLAKNKESAEEAKKLKDIEKISQIIKRQDRKLKEFEDKIKENRIKGDLIYENFENIEKILSIIKNAKNKGLNFEEIENKMKQSKTKFKDLEIFDKIDKKNKKVVFNLQLQH